jgi:hypothetical protein
MDETQETLARRRQHLALIEFQVQVLQQQIALYRADELVERKGPRPAGPARGLAIVKAG